MLAKKDPIEQNWRKLGPIWTQNQIRTYLKKLDENWDQKGILTYSKYFNYILNNVCVVIINVY